MDPDEKEKLEEQRKKEERRARIALKNCKHQKIIISYIYRPKRNRGNKTQVIYILWQINFIR